MQMASGQRWWYRGGQGLGGPVGLLGSLHSIGWVGLVRRIRAAVRLHDDLHVEQVLGDLGGLPAALDDLGPVQVTDGVRAP